MEDREALETPGDGNAIIVKADEVDEAGADISTLSSSDAPDSDLSARVESRRAQDAQSQGSPKILANALPNPPRAATRPILRREGSSPAPPQQPPPPAPLQAQEDTNNHTDSLSLLQLRRLVSDLPKLEPIAYAYEYSETRSFPEELEEWFSYTEEDKFMLLQAKETFEGKWKQAQAETPHSSEKSLQWTEMESEDRESFVVGAIKSLDSHDITSRIRGLECISYIALGVWSDTAGLQAEKDDVNYLTDDKIWVEAQKSNPLQQLAWMINGCRMLCKYGAAQKLLDVMIRLWQNEQNIESTEEVTRPQEDGKSERFEKLVEINQTLTTLYMLVETSRWQYSESGDVSMVQAIVKLQPSLLVVLTEIIAKLRWDENSFMPLPRVLLLFWKSQLLLFGSLHDLNQSKRVLSEGLGPAQNDNFITASPLDYHLFRQEITSKYPAYSPPPPLVPIEPENNSILPPLPTHPSRRASQDNLQSSIGASVTSGSGSIFNQPVHIATPAPSPPPSPAGPGGKGGKKQNYQTNQNFPFLYPPLDDTSNTVGGRGQAGLQDQLVGKRWQGSDVPASILEAGQLFASRMRMSRSIRQLWDVRERYIKYERGWNESPSEDMASSECSSEDGDGYDKHTEESKDDIPDQRKKNELGRQKVNGAHNMTEIDDRAVQGRLDAVNEFYRDALPHLQSLVMVLWRVLFGNVSALVAQNGQNGLSFGEDGANDGPGKRRTNPNSSVNIHGMANGDLTDQEDGIDHVIEELSAVRSREITSKATSGILLLLLKWLKLSHILKFEYLTQLILDANYVPLILKYFAHQDTDRAVDHKNDHEDLNFFNFCHTHSKHPPTSSPDQPALSSSNSSDDDAAPPPILRHRRSPTSHSPPPSPTPPPAPRPEVDELGYPTTGALPQTPLTLYAPRFFLTNINLLRLLQKITKRKAHRALLLVSYKSSTILRKALKIPQPDLRLYTLKLFKSQVPYCGRKWRQTNMRVITAIYLHCRPELRDEWLCGGDVDGVVEEALPLEQAGRSLVHWWHLRNFREVMEGNSERERKSGRDEVEYNFFARELEKMGWGVGGVGNEEADDHGSGDPTGPTEFEGSVTGVDGWG